MSVLRRFGLFWWDFVVGDDPGLALAVVAALVVAVLLAALGVSAWWVLPVAGFGALAWSVRRAVRR